MMLSWSMILFALVLVCFNQSSAYPNHSILDDKDEMEFQFIKEMIGETDFYEEDDGDDDEPMPPGDEDTQGAPLKKSENKRWPGGVVPYVLSSGFKPDQVAKIRTALRTIERAAPCLSFKEYREGDRSVPNTHVHVRHEGGCWSLIGRTSSGKKQFMALSYYCLKQKTIMHEFLHALGFYHEQARPDRDRYIKIYWNRIKEKSEGNFKMTKRSNDLGVGYDRVSIMHYTSWAFAKKGMGKTIEWLADPSLPLSGDKLSAKDILQLNRLYCDGSIRTTARPKPKTTVVTKKSTTTYPTTTKLVTKKRTTTTTYPTTTKLVTKKRTTTTIYPTKGPKKSICGDREAWCFTVRAGRCRNNYYSMRCPRTCGTCTGPESDRCKNLANRKTTYECEKMADDGMCVVDNMYRRYTMKISCARTCCERNELYYSY